MTVGLITGAVVGGVAAAGVALVEILPGVRCGASSYRCRRSVVDPHLRPGVPLGWSCWSPSGGAGLLGAGFRLLPERVARPVGVGLAVTLICALLQRVFPPLLFELGLDTRWIYSPVLLGLTSPGRWSCSRCRPG